MLNELKIKNYALLENLKITFDKGLSILTGETGAGKSILVGALGLLLGERASSESIRTGADFAKIDGVFEINQNQKLKNALDEIGLDTEDDILIVSRRIQRDGKNKCYINGGIVTLAMLRQVGNYLVDLHGQHEHQSLLKVENQRDYIDTFGDLIALREEVKELYRDYRKYQNELRKIEQVPESTTRWPP